MEDDSEVMHRAIDLAWAVRTATSPNPWVGCVLVAADGQRFEGATQPPGGAHAEAVALAAAGRSARGATVYTTLEPCSHHGRTPPCADALIEAGVARVVWAIDDPDPQVAGAGIARLRAAGIAVDRAPDDVARLVADQLAPYLHQRRTGRPWVILKLAASLDGRTAAADGTSRWITGAEARADAHRLRVESDAVLVGAGTVRADDPLLTARPPGGLRAGEQQPLRVVLGQAPAEAAVHPCLEMSGDLGEVLDTLGAKGVLQLMVEGGAAVAGDFHRAGLVDRYVIYIAPALFGGDDGRGLFAGAGASTMADVWRGRISAVSRLGDDLRIDLLAGSIVQPDTDTKTEARTA